MAFPLLLSSLVAYAAADQTLAAADLQQTLAGDIAQSCDIHAEIRSVDIQKALTEIYQRLGFEYLWQQPQRLHSLQAELVQLTDDGLESEDYSFALNAGSAGDSCSELRISAEYLLALEHLSRGRLAQADYESVWRASPLPTTSAPLLMDLAMTGLSVGISTAFDQARPGLMQYRSLRATYAAMDKSPPERLPIPAGPLLRPGISDVRLEQIRKQLLEDGFLSASQAEDVSPELYDGTLEQAVRRFQSNQGLQADGIIGPQTIRAMNITLKQRLQQVQINLERLRWINAERSDYLLLINVASGHLQLLRDNDLIWQARAQTGRASRPTPALVSNINRITLNPGWTVPPTILREDILPQIRRNPEYLESRGIQILDAQGNQLEPQQINWSNPRGIVLRQPPGPTNPLGQIVFRLPNPYSIYLHDTPSQQLFQQTNRNVSSGCVRVEDADGLAEQLFAHLSESQRERIAGQLASGQTHEVPLMNGPQVILAYWTAYADEDGRPAFFPDTYGLDPVLGAALADLETAQPESIAGITMQAEAE
ncbi:MAG: L,D-transpeptidase family protein [Pseudohongiella sp.]|nr:L,D-transpeptidase family protein [Pseudohongiella sp.]